MKSLSKLGAVVCLLVSVSLGQGVRFGDSNPTQTTTSVPGISGKFLIVIPNATINFCHAPANAVPCTNKQTTYTDATLSTACSNSTQIVLAGTNNCVGSTDSLGNWGVWVPSGVYEYTLSTGGLNYGPFEAVIASGGLGNQKSVPNCTAAGTVLNETVQETSQVVAGVTQTCATVGAIGSTGIIGICQSSCGNSGPAIVATGNTNLCIFDNQATQGDYVVPSSSVTGFCSDAGAVKPSSAIETLGIVSIANVGGAGNAGTVQVAPLSLLLPGSNGGSGIVTNCASAAGANAFYPGVGTIVSCDPLVTDSNGVLTMNGANFVDNTFGGYFRQQQGPAPSLSAANSVYVFPPTSVGTTYGLQWPGTAATGCVNGTLTGSVVALSFAANPCGSGAGSVTSITASAPVVVTPSPIVSTGVVSCPTCTTGIVTGTLATPSAPVLTTNGSAGVVSYTYGVVGCQDTGCVYHTPISATTTIATGNATLTSSNSINLKTFGDTFYGVRGFLICRTASAGTPGTTGIITGNLAAPLLAGKIFTDTGLAGDGTNCASTYAANTTVTTPFCQIGSSLPGAGLTTPGFPCGVDAPPLVPNAFDDEYGENFGAPGDVNNSGLTWGGAGTSAPTQGGATAVWSNGTLILTTDSTTQGNALVNAVALPATPYTFVAYLDNVSQATNGNGETCFIGLRESSTGKMMTADLDNAQTQTVTSAAGGFVWLTVNWTSNTARTAVSNYEAYQTNQAYVKIQNDGTNLKVSFSPNGIAYKQWTSELITAAFTTAPNQLLIGGAGISGQAAVCTFDYLRRTQ